jgi:geranylgeranyl diphosphate synthase type II
MDVMARIERALETALAEDRGGTCPPKLSQALHYTVFPGGHRLRPRLCLTVARACGDPDPVAADAAACAIEFLHCASLAHDDLPCFDDAETRRGKPTVHKIYGEPIAVLAGDALIVLAFETLARGMTFAPEKLARMVGIVGAAAGAPGGICAGQAWESEAVIPLGDYHRAKTGALFGAATAAGALAAGANPDLWRALGAKLGEAYQVADDIRDMASSEEEAGKPIGQDVAHGRPSAARELGLAGAIRLLDQLVDEAVGSIPECPHQAHLKAAITLEARRFLPPELARSAA